MAVDPHVNPQTGVWDDNYYANIGKYSNGSASGGGGVNDILSSAISSLMGFMPKAVKPYDSVHPFSFDEALAKEAATKEYSPYYDEKLADYVSTVQRNLTRSQEDKQSTIENLNAGKEYYMGTQKKLLDRAMNNTNEGYAGNGLFFSGAREDDINQLTEDFNDTTGEYLREFKYGVGQAEKTQKRLSEDLSTEKSQYTRDIGREKELAITQGVLQRKSEAVQEYEMGRQKYYDAAQYGGIG